MPIPCNFSSFKSAGVMAVTDSRFAAKRTNTGKIGLVIDADQILLRPANSQAANPAPAAGGRAGEENSPTFTRSRSGVCSKFRDFRGPFSFLRPVNLS
jgi:hypothetical protein